MKRWLEALSAVPAPTTPSNDSSCDDSVGRLVSVLVIFLRRKPRHLTSRFQKSFRLVTPSVLTLQVRKVGHSQAE